MAKKISEYIQEAAVKSNELIKKARLNDYSVFEDGKKLRYLFDLISYMDGYDYCNKLSDLSFDIRYYKDNNQSYKIPQVYTYLDLYIQEAFGRLFKKMLTLATDEGDDYFEKVEQASSKQQTRKTDIPKPNNNARAVNPYLNGNSNSKSSTDRNDRNYRGGSKSVNPYI